uniref:Putative adenylate cyclase regulatory protein n=1 Tax=Rhizophora mucronata TaxID=61149 RepID=A0A2P2MWZ9_RHIMU
MKITYLEFFLEGIANAEAQSGWETYTLDLSMIYSGKLANVHPLWNYVLNKYVMYTCQHYAWVRLPIDLSGLTCLLCVFLEQDIDKYKTFSMLPRDISQQIFNELVYSQRLNH